VLVLGEPLPEPTEPVLVEAVGDGEVVELVPLPVPIDVLGVEPKLLELLNPP